MGVFKKIFQVAIPVFFIAGLFNLGVSYESLQATSSRFPELCLFHHLTGWLCPFCGLTRAMISFFSYNWRLSFFYHPVGPLLGLGLVALWAMSFWPWRFEKALWILERTARENLRLILVIALIWGVGRNLINL